MSHSRKNKLMAATALSLMAASPLAAEADPTGARTASLGPAGEVTDASTGKTAKRSESKAERQYRVLYRRTERAEGRPPGRHIVEDGVRDGRRARAATRREIERSISELRAGLGGGSTGSVVKAARGATAATGSSSSSAPASGALESIAACESGGDPGAVGGGGQYRGKYQFDQGTWASVGGSGDPAAASESEQDSRAAALVAQQGTVAWPNCGG